MKKQTEKSICLTCIIIAFTVEKKQPEKKIKNFDQKFEKTWQKINFKQ